METKERPAVIKALTISQPYASLIASGEKWIENRRWETNYRGQPAIHAGKGTQYLDREELAEYPTGCIVAVAWLAACVRLESFRKFHRAQTFHEAARTVGEILDHEHCEGPWLWILRDVRKLPAPVPYKGAQGLWNVPASELIS